MLQASTPQKFTQNHGSTYTSMNKEISNETLCRHAMEV